MGDWRTAEIGYLKASRTHCDLCGQLVPGRYWVAEVGGEERRFCGPEHERKYFSYWLPRYGPKRSS
jgi:hypothetical protein